MRRPKPSKSQGGAVQKSSRGSVRWSPGAGLIPWWQVPGRVARNTWSFRTTGEACPGLGLGRNGGNRAPPYLQGQDKKRECPEAPGGMKASAGSQEGRRLKHLWTACSHVFGIQDTQ